ncbi:NAD(P)-dependent oxidoreductase [Aquisalimonas sp.]|uniref:NAD(P)-dependent oxidoreductase n=1 Tax=Aquisalimonas sp. TaxID=1872621 RepID=UPI0025BF8FFD|nr:NAD(P)-dependent oxidoreductase [Aquisalimonas sp.]
MKVGVIGMGAMGTGMARNLHKAGLLAAVWNRTPEKARAIADELGAVAAVDPASLARECDAIITCVSRDEDVLAVMDAMAGGLSAGKTVVDTSTVAVDTAKQSAAKLAAANVEFLDAPVSGGKEGAQSGQLVFMIGGDADTVERLRPAFDAMGKSATHMGEVGSGQATKAVNQIMVAGINQGVTEALAFGQASGLDMDKVIEVVGGGAAGNWFLQMRGPTMVKGTFEPGFKLGLHHKDLTICRHMLDTMNVALPIVEMTLKHYERLMAAGHGDEDISALYRDKRQLFRGGNKKSL